MPIFTSEKRKIGNSRQRAVLGRVSLLIVIACLLGALSAQYTALPHPTTDYRIVVEVDPAAPLLVNTFQNALVDGLRERGVEVITVDAVELGDTAQELAQQNNALLAVWSADPHQFSDFQHIVPAQNMPTDFRMPREWSFSLAIQEDIHLWVLMIQGIAAYYDANYEVAVGYLKQAQTLPHYPNYYVDLYLASSYNFLHEYEAAFHVLAAYGDNGGSYILYNYAVTAAKLGKFTTAYRALEHFLANGYTASFPQSYCLHAEMAQHLRLYQVALRDTAMAQQNCSLKGITPALALEQIRTEIVPPAPDSENYELNLFRYYIDLGDYSAAIQTARSMLIENPEDAYWLNKVGYAQLGQQDYQAAYQTFDQVTELDPENAYAWAMRGKTAMLLNSADLEIGEQDLRHALELNPDYYGTYLIWGLVYESWANPAKAAPLYLQWLQRPETQWQTTRPMHANSVELEMHEGYVYAFTLELTEPQQLDIIAAADNPYTLDPLLILLDENGNAILGSDDLNAQDMNSHISTTTILPAGTYTLLVSHAGGGSEGNLLLSTSAH